jgi:hypothetical protein
VSCLPCNRVNYSCKKVKNIYHKKAAIAAIAALCAPSSAFTPRLHQAYVNQQADCSRPGETLQHKKHVSCLPCNRVNYSCKKVKEKKNEKKKKKSEKKKKKKKATKKVKKEAAITPINCVYFLIGPSLAYPPQKGLLPQQTTIAASRTIAPFFFHTQKKKRLSPRSTVFTF